MITYFASEISTFFFQTVVDDENTQPLPNTDNEEDFTSNGLSDEDDDEDLEDEDENMSSESFEEGNRSFFCS